MQRRSRSARSLISLGTHTPVAGASYAGTDTRVCIVNVGDKPEPASVASSHLPGLSAHNAQDAQTAFPPRSSYFPPSPGAAAYKYTSPYEGRYCLVRWAAHDVTTSRRRSSARSNPSRHKSQRLGVSSYHRLRTINIAAEDRGNRRYVSLAYRWSIPGLRRIDQQTLEHHPK